MSVLPYLIIFLLPLSVVVGYYLGGFYTFLSPLFVFGFIPVLDMILGVDTKNADREEEENLLQNKMFAIIPALTTPIQFFLVMWGAYVVTRGNMSLLELIGFTLSVGISGGAMGINVAHELVHKFGHPFRRFLGHLNLLMTWYVHWGDEHVKGHHRFVATPEDPTTARKGESFYSFFPRTLIGSYRKAWMLEEERLKRLNLPVDSFHNRVFWALIGPLFVSVLLGLYFGSAATLFFIMQSFIAIGLLEVTNYIEHYGLMRKRDNSGRYERVLPIHSWNASNIVTNYFLFNLQRHSDHHFKARRPYQILRHFDESPQLPTGYAGMILIALIPSWWFKVMDHRIPEASREAARAHFLSVGMQD